MNGYDDLLGKEFAYRGRGPDRFDCYGLVREMARRDGVQFPDFISNEDANVQHAMIVGQMQFWKKVETPRRGLVAVFRIGRAIRHVGYVLDRANFIHICEGGAGVTTERLVDWQQRLVGFYEYQNTKVDHAV